MSGRFDLFVQMIHSFRPSTEPLQPWLTLIHNPEPPKDSKERAHWSRYSFSFYEPMRLPLFIERQIQDAITSMLNCLAVLTYKKVLADLTKSEIEALLQSLGEVTDIYDAYNKLVTLTTHEYQYLLEHETGVEVV